MEETKFAKNEKLKGHMNFYNVMPKWSLQCLLNCLNKMKISEDFSVILMN